MKTSDESWGDCPAGTLQSMVAGMQETRRRAVLHRVTSAMAAALLIGAAVWLSVQTAATIQTRRAAASSGPMACSEVEQLLVQYGRGSLAKTLEAKIAAHLDQCPHCRQTYRKTHAGADGHQSQASRPTRAVAQVTSFP